VSVLTRGLAEGTSPVCAGPTDRYRSHRTPELRTVALILGAPGHAVVRQRMARYLVLHCC
jgi:hypothetical protein